MPVSTITSANSFIGNGVDSYVSLEPLLSVPTFFACSSMVKIGDTLSPIFGLGGSRITPPSVGSYFQVDIKDGFIRVYSHNTTYQKVFTGDIPLIKDVTYSIFVSFKIADGFVVKINNVLDNLTEVGNYAPLVSYVTPLEFSLGALNNAYAPSGNNTLYETYWSTNPLAIDEETIKQYATGEEHFTQTLPDVVSIDTKTFIGDGVVSHLVKNIGTNFTTFIGATFKVKVDSLGTDQTFFSLANSNNVNDLSPLFFFMYANGTVACVSYGIVNDGNQRKYRITTTALSPAVETEISVYLDLSNPTDNVHILFDGIEQPYGGSDNDTFSSLDTYPSMAILFGSPVNSIDGSLYDAYFTTNPLGKTPSLIKQYATIEEHFTQSLPDVVPTFSDSFIGNGVDSGVKINNGQFSTFVSVLATIKLDSAWANNGVVWSMSDKIANITQPIRFYIRPNRRVQVIVYAQTPDVDNRKYVYSFNEIPLNVETEIFFYLDLSDPLNQIQLFINGELATIELSDNDSIGQIYTSPTTELSCGIGHSFGSFTDPFLGEISRLYYSSNSLAITPELCKQHATGQEHFTQAAPDALPSAWLGGAVQGIIKEGWLGGAAQGVVYFETVEDFLVEVSKIDISSHEHYVEISDLIINVLTLEINSPEQYIKITTPVEGPSVVEVISLDSSIKSTEPIFTNKSTVEVSSPEQYAGTTDYCTMPSDYFNYSNECHENEKKLYDKLITEAFDQVGIKCDYYVVDFSTDNEQVLGEDNDKHIVRNFKLKVYFETPPEERQYDTFGISDLDVFSMYASKAAFNIYSRGYIPMTGDLIRPKYNGVIYEIVNVVDTDEQFLNSQHTWRFTVKVWVNEKPTTDDTVVDESTDTYDGNSIEPIAEQTSATDILEQNELVDEEIKNIGYNDNNGNPFGGW